MTTVPPCLTPELLVRNALRGLGSDPRRRSRKPRRSTFCLDSPAMPDGRVWTSGNINAKPVRCVCSSRLEVDIYDRGT